MENIMTLEIILGLLLRQALTLLGGGALAQGLLAGDTVNQIAGVTATVVSIGLSVLNKKKLTK